MGVNWNSSLRISYAGKLVALIHCIPLQWPSHPLQQPIRFSCTQTVFLFSSFHCSFNAKLYLIGHRDAYHYIVLNSNKQMANLFHFGFHMLRTLHLCLINFIFCIAFTRDSKRIKSLARTCAGIQ